MPARRIAEECADLCEGIGREQAILHVAAFLRLILSPAMHAWFDRARSISG
jgi:hypothetical protein